MNRAWMTEQLETYLAILQEIIDRSRADNYLMNHLLGQNPKLAQMILRLPGAANASILQSRNRAIRALAEYLAALSVLARWLDECEAQTAP